MGKKQRTVNYDRTNLQGLANYMEGVRTPVSGGHLPRFQISLDGLEATIKSLPNKARQTIEKFWGLTPGTINHSCNRASLGDVAYRRMFSDSKEVLKNIFTLEYSSKYEPNVEATIHKLAKKVNKSGLQMSDVEVVNYLNMLFVFFYGGPNMFFETEDAINTEVNEEATLDEYALLVETWEELKDRVPDGSINLKLLIQAIEMFDLKDIITMKNFSHINVNKEDRKAVEKVEEVKNLQQVRKFKEKLFPYGGWWTTIDLILQPSEVDLIRFMEYLDLFRQDWENIQLFKFGTKTIMTTQGQKELQVYNIGGLEFTDPYEVMLLYVARNLIFQEK